MAMMPVRKRVRQIVVVGKIPGQFDEHVRVALVHFLSHTHGQMGEIVALEARGKEGDGIGPPRTQGPARQVDFIAEFAGGVTHALRGFGLDVILASQGRGGGGGGHSGQFADIL